MEFVIAYPYNQAQGLQRERFMKRNNPMLTSDLHLLWYYRMPRADLQRLINRLEPILRLNCERRCDTDATMQVRP